MTVNLPDLYPEDAAVDQTAYCILLRVTESEDPVWKSRLHRRLNEWRSGDLCPLNLRETVSLQTVCRRVDDLVADGLLAERPAYSEGQGQYRSCYELTADGEEVFAAITEQMEHNLVRTYLEHTLAASTLELAAGVFEKLRDNPYSHEIEDPEDLREASVRMLESMDGAEIRVGA